MKNLGSLEATNNNNNILKKSLGVRNTPNIVNCKGNI